MLVKMKFKRRERCLKDTLKAVKEALVLSQNHLVIIFIKAESSISSSIISF